MTKKIVALCALFTINSFVGANGYPAGQGYQVPQEGPHHGHDKHHHEHHGHHNLTYNTEDKRALDSYEKEIEEIKKEGQNPYLKSNICWLATAVGVLGLAKSGSNGELQGALFSGILAVGAGSIGIYTRSGEAAKVAEREAQIKDRRDRQDKIRSRYHH